MSEESTRARQMTCQHCQTWILDDDHRCPRCGRRVRSTPSRISPATYPIAATATAAAYDFETAPADTPAPPGEGQQPLFTAAPTVQRVVPFELLTSPAERTAIRQRFVEAQRPSPLRSEKIESRRARAKRGVPAANQRNLDFPREERITPSPHPGALCQAPVATAGVRCEAALFDALLMACGFGPGLAAFFYVGGHFTADKHVLPFLAAALLSIPLLYKLLWAFAGRDTPGTRIAGLELVDFDGRKPSRSRRYVRLFGSFLSLLAAALGMIWTLVDEDRLTWHDHMSGTFPTFAGEVLEP